MSLQTTPVFFKTNVVPLGDMDFLVNSDVKLKMAWDNCTLVLFYDASDASRSLAEIWSTTAQEVSGPKFGAVNLMSEQRVSDALIQLKMSPDHPFSWIGSATAPFIVTYRNGWPQAFYNGNLTTEAIKNYSLQLACQPGYKEYTYSGASSTPAPAPSSPAPTPSTGASPQRPPPPPQGQQKVTQTARSGRSF